VVVPPRPAVMPHVRCRVVPQIIAVDELFGTHK
jgi:hypothetical protein